MVAKIPLEKHRIQTLNLGAILSVHGQSDPTIYGRIIIRLRGYVCTEIGERFFGNEDTFRTPHGRVADLQGGLSNQFFMVKNMEHD